MLHSRLPLASCYALPVLCASSALKRISLRAMAGDELATSWWPADPLELSWGQTVDLGLGDLTADQQFGGLLSTIAPQSPLQMEDYLAQDDAMMDPQLDDADLVKWIAEFQNGASNPSPSPEMNIHHQMEDEDMEMKLLLRGPKDETHLPPMFGVPLEHAYDIHQCEDKFYSVIGGDARAAVQMHLNHEIKDCIVKPSLLVPTQGSWGQKGQRKSRTRSAYSKEEEASHTFGFIGDTKFGARKKKSHWTSYEVKKLLEGMSKYGVGKWAKVKAAYFETSSRKAADLKDKWRDLLRACGINVGSKKKVKAHSATQEMLKGLKYKIKNIASSAFR